MRKLLTLLVICAFYSINAQVFSENFDNGVPGTMTQTAINGSMNWSPCGSSTGGAPCPLTGTGSATFFVANYTAFSTALVTPELDLSTGVFKLNFNHVQRAWGSDVNELHVDISTNGGATWTTMESYTSEVYQPTERLIILSPFSPTTTTQIRFRAVNHYGYRLILDDIEISEVTTDDIKIESIDVNSIIPNGEVEIKGSIKNEGFNTLTTFDLNWQIGDEEIHTQNYSGQNITPGQIFNFNHVDTWTASPGNYELKVWISNPNVNDVNNSNDEITKSISVASGSVYKTPLYEKFSSSTCPPCYIFNTSYFSPFFESYGSSKATYISYQVNWPGVGDPYYTAEVGARVSYYGITAAPTLLLNTVEGTFMNQNSLKQHLDNTINQDGVAFFEIDADHTIDGNNIEVTVDVASYLTGDFVVRTMVLEKETTGNIGNNNETEFHHVFMKALPNSSGLLTSFVHDETQSFTFTADLSSTNVEEMDDLIVVVFIQNPATKEIMQSAYTASSGYILGLEDQLKSNIALIPNPTSGIVKIISESPLNIQVHDLTGKNVFSQKNVTNNSTLNLTGLAKGVYIVKMQDEKGGTTVKKLIIK